MAHISASGRDSRHPRPQWLSSANREAPERTRRYSFARAEFPRSGGARIDSDVCFVSNDCYFCQHATAQLPAYRLGGDEKLIDAVKAIFNQPPSRTN